MGSVVFQLVADGKTVFQSGVLRGSSATLPIKVDVSGVKQLALVVNDAGDGNHSDHADWAGGVILNARPFSG